MWARGWRRGRVASSREVSVGVEFAGCLRLVYAMAMVVVSLSDFRHLMIMVLSA